MIPNKNNTRSIALLIDGDNAQANTIKKIITEISQYGIITIRRIYGDWTEPNMQSWKNILHAYAIQPIQQSRIVNSKNTTDNAMIINAMDILHEKNVSGFCIVSSDSDFTHLATRIREDKLFVIGVGRETTPFPFKKACSHFITTESLITPPQIIAPPPTEKLPEPVKAPPVKPVAKLPTPTPTPIITKQPEATPITPAQKTLSNKQQQTLLKLFKQAFAESDLNEGWIQINKLGSTLRQCDKTFKPKNYGSSTLTKLIQLHPEWFNTRGKGNALSVFLKI
jgi:uncharacterized LabA/DUF88 family protein